MKTDSGYLTFCTNIFPGESWDAHFKLLKSEIPVIKKRLAPEQKFGIGLRLSNEASVELIKPERLKEFQEWLTDNNCFVFTMNGFPYGNFHKTRVKDQVHAPDWTTKERLDYTLRLARILSALLPENMEGSISTSPLSYKYWFAGDPDAIQTAFDQSTKNIVQLVLSLLEFKKTTGKIIHIDIEPEADGLLESGDEFIHWYLNRLLPAGTDALKKTGGLDDEDAASVIKKHIQLCYDVCHFAIGYENASDVIQKLDQAEIGIGKWQLSAALKIDLHKNKKEKLDALKAFNEPVYLHQVVARTEEGALLRYRDLPEAFASEDAIQAKEWRAHYHVPLFIKEYGRLQSTQEEVVKVLQIQKQDPVSDYMEVETYTWEVLPEDLKLPLSESIIREIQWVTEKMDGAMK